MKVLYIVILLIFYLLEACSNNHDPYQQMIQYMLADSTLIDELFCEKCDRITDYSVHDIVNSNAWGYQETKCLQQIENYEKVVEYWLANRYEKKSGLSEYSTSEVSDFHVFFNERVDNIQAMFVFYLKASNETPYYSTDLMYNKPFDIIWRFNQGVIYIFEFDEQKGTINHVCRETQQYD